MKKQLRNLFILIIPFLVMIIINELIRPTIEEKPHHIYGVTAMNSKTPFFDKCTWTCYHNTNFCKRVHVKTLRPFIKFIDPIYFGIIDSLHATGNYGLANVIFLVLLLPFLMFFLFIKILDLQSQITKLKSKS